MFSQFSLVPRLALFSALEGRKGGLRASLMKKDAACSPIKGQETGRVKMFAAFFYGGLHALYEGKTAWLTFPGQYIAARPFFQGKRLLSSRPLPANLACLAPYFTTAERRLMVNKAMLPRGLYGMTAEKFSQGRSNIEVARAMIEGGVRVLQYREKRPDKTFSDMLAECRVIRQLTREAGVLFIINDYPTLVLLAEADGLHIGQNDWPLAEARALLGAKRIIGVSTRSPEEAEAALAGGASYLGAGPIFATQTKADAGAALGLEYIDYLAAHCPIPFVALGGIREDTLPRVIARGAPSACLVSDIVAAPDIRAKVRRLQAMFP